MGSLDAIFTWLGTDKAVYTSLVAALGGGSPKLRDIVYIQGPEWDKVILGLSVTVSEGVQQAPTTIQLGQLRAARRIARLRLGLRAIEEAPAAQLPGPPASAAYEPASSQLVNALGLRASTTSLLSHSTEPRLKLSVIIDPTLDSELVRLPQSTIRQLFSEYTDARGAPPSEEVEPTVEQISAVAQLVAADLVPYADFAILGPHGRRLLAKLTYLAWSFHPDGTWTRRDLPGPPTFEHWWASYRVLRVIYLLLDVAPPEVLDNYGEMLRSFATTYGSQGWFLVYQADVRMRSEHFDRLRRQAERVHLAAVSAHAHMPVPITSTFDVAKPWKSVFAMAIADKLWWDENLHRPAMLYLTKLRSQADSTEDGTAQPALENGAGTHVGVVLRPRRSRSRTPLRRIPKLQPRRGAEVLSKKGKPVCQFFNSKRGCRHSDGDCKDLHICSLCRQTGHSAASGVCRPDGYQGGGRKSSPQQDKDDRKRGGGGGKKGNRDRRR